MKYTATGIVKEIFPEFQVSSTFKKRELIIDIAEEGDKPNPIKFEAIQDNVASLDGFKVSDLVNAEFRLEGREWTNPQGEVKFFMNAKLDSIVLANNNPAPQQAQQQAPPATAFELPSYAVMTSVSKDCPAMPDLNAGGVPEDDIPFAKLGEFGE